MLLQVPRGLVGGIDHQVGAVAQPLHEAALELDHVGNRPLGVERVAAPGLGIAPDQDVVLAIEKQGLDVDVGAVGQTVELFQERLDREIAGPDIDPDRERTALGLGAPPDQPGQQRQRQIVDRLEAHVLERLQRRRTPGARHPGDQDDPVGRGSSAVLGHVHGPLANGLHRSISSGPSPTARRTFAAAEASNGAR